MKPRAFALFSLLFLLLWFYQRDAFDAGRGPFRLRPPLFGVLPPPPPPTEPARYQELVSTASAGARVETANCGAILAPLSKHAPFRDPRFEAGRHLLHGIIASGCARAFSSEALRWAREADRAFLLAFALRESLALTPTTDLGFVKPPPEYPKGLRDSARDTISYLYAAFLMTRHEPLYPPDGDRQVDIRDLVRHARADRVALDPTALPVERAAAVLDDLEAWHLREGRRGAALEVRLERARLFAELSKPVRALVKEDLETRLPAFRDLPWYSMGMVDAALLAEPDTSPPHDARTLANFGARAFPGTLGATHAKAILKVLDLTASEPEASVTVGETRGRRELIVKHKGKGTILLQARPVSNQWLLAGEWPQLHGAFGTPAPAGPSAARWRLTLPESPGRRQLTTTAPLPPLPNGLYRIDARLAGESSPASLLVFLSDIVAVVTTGDEASVILRVLGRETGLPVAGAEVRLYSCAGQGGTRAQPVQPGPVATTDARGIVRCPLVEGAANHALVRYGKDVAILSGLDQARRPWSPTSATELSMGRRLVEPGSAVPFHLSLLRQERPGLAPRPLAQATIEVTASTGQVETKALFSTNEFGTVASTIQVPGSARNAMSIRARLVDQASRPERFVYEGTQIGILDSAEKTPPISLTRLPPFQGSKWPVRFEGLVRQPDAGGPARDVEISWSVKQRRPTPICPELFSCTFAETARTLAEGQASSDGTGRFLIRVDGSDADRTLVVRARYPSGELKTATFSLSYLEPRLSLGIGGPSVASASAGAAFTVGRLVDRRPRAGASWLSVRRATISPGAEPGEEVYRKEISHDSEGLATALVPPLPPGSYAVSVASKELGGASVEAALLLVGKGFPPAPLTLATLDGPPDAPMARVFLASEKTPVHVDILSPGGAVETEVIDARGGLFLDVVAGSVVQAFVVRDGVVERAQAAVRVARDPLRIELSSGVDTTRRGALDVLVSRNDGRPAAGVEVFASLTARDELFTTVPPFPDRPGRAEDSVPGGAIVESAGSRTIAIRTSGPLHWKGSDPANLVVESHGLMRVSRGWECPQPMEMSAVPALHRRSRAQPTHFMAQTYIRLAQPSLPPVERAPALFQPHAITDAEGRVRIPFRADPRGHWRLTIRAVDREGRRGSLTRLVS